MPKPTSFIKEEASASELAPILIRRIGTAQEWLLEEHGQEIGRLKKSSPFFSLSQDFEFRTEGERWTIRKRLLASPFASRKIYSGDRFVGTVQPVMATDPKPSIFMPANYLLSSARMTTAGRLQIEEAEYTCLRSGLRYDINVSGRRAFQIQIPWQDSAAEQKILYYLWPDSPFQASEYPLVAIMPLFWLGLTAYDRDRMQQF